MCKVEVGGGGTLKSQSEASTIMYVGTLPSGYNASDVFKPRIAPQSFNTITFERVEEERDFIIEYSNFVAHGGTFQIERSKVKVIIHKSMVDLFLVL